ncbi:zinc finger BED domain-containing protein 4 [Engraulis encrasicolus]|uniref:zinc finger BED domain-containing protein 4 n=1 Tax=Engraulis encrasicolus TaxID=184585 RepID=UPI002FD5CF48
MASNTRVSILDYFNIVFEGENGKIESNCKACGTRIQAKRTVTSNFVTHLKRKHQAMYDEFVRRKDVKREAYSSGTLQTFSANTSGGGGSRASFQNPGTTQVVKFDRGDPRQTLVSEAIAKMIVRDLQPVQIVENEGFRELLKLLEPRYTPEPCHYIQQQLLPAYAYQVQLATKQALIGAESCSVTLDLWRAGAGAGASGYLGVTCHFITTDWQMKTALLACVHLTGHHIPQRVLSEFEEISHAHGIAGMVFRVVADLSPCDTRPPLRLPGFSLHCNGEEDEDEEEEEESSDEETGVGGEAKDAAMAGVVGMDNNMDSSLGQCLGRCRIDCFARSLGLCVREGLRSSTQISIVLAKAACFYNYVTATVAPEKLGQVFGPGMSPVASAQQASSHTTTTTTSQAGDRLLWNVQLKAVRRMLESLDFLEDIVDRQDLALSGLEKALLRELVEVLEPFEEATDMVLVVDKHVAISLALPCVLGLRKHLSETTTATNTRHCTAIVASLAQALDRRLAGILEDPLYVTATTLDPQFKLTWSSDTDWHKQVLLEEIAKHTQSPAISPTEASPLEAAQAAQPSPSKRGSKLFSFIKQRPTTQAKSLEQELAAYLHEGPTEEEPLHYWRRKSIDFPLLAQVAKKVFTVPATTTAVERIFSTVGKQSAGAGAERCRQLPKNLETLIYLKANYKLLWT